MPGEEKDAFLERARSAVITIGNTRHAIRLLDDDRRNGDRAHRGDNGGSGAGPAHRPGDTTVLNLNQRITAWWVMLAVAGTGIVAGSHATIALFALCSRAAVPAGAVRLGALLNNSRSSC
ncbi:hypothetical protein AAH991_26710 [Microbispora sp. ZYX-F-249]|uniref:DUF3040 domain-containing protein n=1 Tax=Microbispora maris TaxID=3144104 RepID=A0ABV0AVK2_9ACTN